MTDRSVPHVRGQGAQPHEDDTRAGIRGAAASLAQVASQITGATAEPGETRTVAGIVQVNTQRAVLACLSLAAHAGRLETLAVVRADAEHAARAELEAEAQRDARLYADDKGTSGDAAPTPEEWAAGAFANTYEDGGVIDRDAAWSVYLAAFLGAVTGTDDA